MLPTLQHPSQPRRTSSGWMLSLLRIHNLRAAPQPTHRVLRKIRKGRHSSPSRRLSSKPFVPSSTFGQNMISSQTTGGSASGGPLHARGLRQQQQPSDMDDLLGDNDPEISKNLTQETTELANLSNQVGTLSNQMQEVKSKGLQQSRNCLQARRSASSNADSQLRSLYEQEVKEVQAIEERLSASISRRGSYSKTLP
jgi:epidermal growth factor receptor substrate 15